MNKPKVSIILPTHNRAAYLAEAVKSVLAQTFQDWELLIIDDGSSDKTQTEVLHWAASEPRIQYFHQMNAGAACARNRGLQHARGEYVAFLDDDDQWTAEKLSHQLSYMEERPELGFTYTLFKIIRAGGPKAGQFKIFPEKIAVDFETMIDSFFIPLPTVMLRRSVLEGMAWFNPAFEISEDQEFWFRLVQRAPVGAIKEVLTFTLMDERAHLGKDPLQVHTYQMKVMRELKLLPGFERYRPLMKKKIARLYYLNGRESIDRGRFLRAGKYFTRALLTDPFVGLAMDRSEKEGAGAKLVRLLKSYAAVPACFLKGLVNARR